MTEYKVSILSHVDADNIEDAVFLGQKALEQEVADRNFDVEKVNHQQSFDVREIGSDS
ncbi:hypothetical protein [Enterococcus plantarum]|uniref:hypothetical protein n=1 Tax=Enterococcus plantarum TaxID=1077675 RepID=UPI0015E88CC0|nr:hypothetical protein [Enterococcus plantarum]